MRALEFLSRSNADLVSSPLLSDDRSRQRWILKTVSRGRRVLDLGCGSGALSAKIQDQNNEVLGLEINPKMAAHARRRGIRVKVADLNEGIPVESASFDVVNAFEILEYIYDSKFLFEECVRVLRPGGLMTLTIHNLNSLENRLRILSGNYLHRHGAFPEDYYGAHIRLFNLAKVRELAQGVGLTVQEVTGAVPEGVGPVPNRSFLPTRMVKNSVVRLYPKLAPLLFLKLRKPFVAAL